MKCAICANRKIGKLLTQTMLPTTEHVKLVPVRESGGESNVLLAKQYK